MKVSKLPLPRLEACELDALHILTDDALARTSGVRVAFTGRAGGVSEGAYAGLNLATHVGDRESDVHANRLLLMRALGAPRMPLIVPSQVHGTRAVSIDDASDDALSAARAKVQQGADALVVSVPDVAALLCFADCAPVVVVSPTGAFSVVHAGWRGAMARICSQAVRALARADAACEAGLPAEAGQAVAPEVEEAALLEAAARYNVYIGPHIHGECFETGPDVRAAFVEAFGETCALDERHVSLARAISIDVAQAGVSPERVVDAGACTVCRSNEYFSYRASGGICGRHGAVAFRKSEVRSWE